MKNYIVTEAKSKSRIGKEINLGNPIESQKWENDGEGHRYENVEFMGKTYNVQERIWENGGVDLSLNQVGCSMNSWIILTVKSK